MATARSRISARLVLVAAAGLALVQCAIEVRARLHAGIGAHAFFGCAPNLFSAITLPFLFAGLTISRGAADYDWSRAWRESRAWAAAVAIAPGGLLGWEFLQPYRPNRTFDWLDVFATLAGALLSVGIVGAGRLLTAHDAHKMESVTP